MSEQQTDSEQPTFVWCEGTPTLVDRPSFWLTTISALVLLVSPWPALLGLQHGSWVTFLTPLVWVIGVMVWSEHVQDRMRAQYVEQLLSENGYDSSDIDLRTRAESEFTKNNTLSNTQTFLCLGFIIYLLACYAVLILRGNNFDWSTFNGWRETGLDAAQMAAAGLTSVLFGIVFVGTIQHFFFKFEDLRTTSKSTLDFQASDQNDLDIASLSIALQALMRRAETYTIESSLLSALSFSAFVGIAFSDQGPIESAEWIQQINANDDCDGANWRVLSTCAQTISQTVPDHIMYIVSFTLLVTSLFFISTLVIRFRFNEAFKYTEELVSFAVVLNEKEVSAKGKIKKEITSRISLILEKVHIGLDDLKPLGDSMKNFRNVGIAFFVFSVSLCSLYFHWTVSALLFGIVATAYVVTYVDSFRRHSSFLPGLESVAMSIWRKKRG